jgi:predicted PhzF superfamily epimerase YddE/YHI9
VAAFQTISGRLTAKPDRHRIALDVPAVPAAQVPTSADLLTALRGTTPVWIGVTGNDDPRERNMIAVLESEELVRRLAPDLEAISRLPVGGLIVTARSPARGVVSRHFAPAFGIPEDPVTGSAHCPIAPYWRDELGTALFAEQASPRGGALTVAMKAGRVFLSGTARTAITGFIH